MLILFEIIAGILIANLYEWIVHKYVLHELGKAHGSTWSSHWSVHHSKVRKNDYFDADYLNVTGGGLNEGKKELIGLLFLLLINAPIMIVAPWCFYTMVGMGTAYFLVHRQSHLNPAWGKRWVPWHYDHHMGKDQDANWCVTLPIWDYILGTRKPRRVKRPSTSQTSTL